MLPQNRLFDKWKNYGIEIISTQTQVINSVRQWGDNGWQMQSLEAKLVLEEFQAVLLVQVPAPKLLVVLSISEVSVNGWIPRVTKCLWSTNICTVTWAEEGGY